MKTYIEERAVEVAKFMIHTNATVRETAKKFGISKSTVHKDITDRVERIDPELAKSVRAVLEVNKAERHIRGGNATRDKYREEARKRGAAASRASRTQNKTGRPEGKPVPQI